MLRQQTQPLAFQATRRPDNVSIVTTGKAGEVIPFLAGPLLRGDSASGRLDINAELAEQPKPLENLVIMRAQMWVVPRPAFPQFESAAEYNHSYEGTDITSKGGAARTPPSLFETVGTGAIAALQASELYRALGLACIASTEVNTDYVDAYNLIQNFRLAAYSSKMTRYSYYSENPVTSLELKPAFWPVNRLHQVVPDYESALVQGALDLDVTAGSLPVTGIGFNSTATMNTGAETVRETGQSGTTAYGANDNLYVGNVDPNSVYIEEDTSNAGHPNIYAQMAGQTISTTLADIDTARKTEAFAKARARMAGTNYSGFNMDDVIVATLMQGFEVPEEFYQRPFLVDSRQTVFGSTERHATDSANLDDSSTVQNARLSLSINIPKMKWGGVYMATVEVMPERMFPRMEDPYMYVTDVSDLPNALRDSQVVLPVDVVPNSRVDVAHTTPTGTYGYEPMNARWRREFTRLGGEHRALTPGAHATTARTATWLPEYVDPSLNSDHWLCQHPFPQDVFSAPSSDVVTISARLTMAVTGITQFGDEIVEDNSDHSTVEAT